jgi:hypothetical protein
MLFLYPFSKSCQEERLPFIQGAERSKKKKESRKKREERKVEERKEEEKQEGRSRNKKGAGR